MLGGGNGDGSTIISVVLVVVDEDDDAMDSLGTIVTAGTTCPVLIAFVWLIVIVIVSVSGKLGTNALSVDGCLVVIVVVLVVGSSFISRGRGVVTASFLGGDSSDMGTAMVSSSLGIDTNVDEGSSGA